MHISLAERLDKANISKLSNAIIIVLGPKQKAALRRTENNVEFMNRLVHIIEQMDEEQRERFLKKAEA